MSAEKVDYDKMYLNSSDEHFRWVKKVCFWKAEILSRLIKDIPMQSILEIGTGRGDVLDALAGFERKIGADISEEALIQHKAVYPGHELIKIDADTKLPFNDNQIDGVLLCDILEHVGKPVELLKEAARVGRYVLLKIPIEKALFFRLMNKIHGIQYGLSHPSGHLHCWTLKETQRLVEQAGLKIVRSQFLPTTVDLLEKKYLLKVITVRLILLADRVAGSHFFSRVLIGGSLFVVAKR